jgi:hypothetical protein
MDHNYTGGADAIQGSVESHIVLACVDPQGRQVDVPTTLSYRADDPYAITMTFHSASSDVTWVVSRDLLVEGISGPAGDGDVLVYPAATEGSTIIDFCSPDGRLTTRTSSNQLRDFLVRSFRVVPAGAESLFLDLDSLIIDLLASA